MESLWTTLYQSSYPLKVNYLPNKTDWYNFILSDG